MCKTCGCAAGTNQLRILVSENSQAQRLPVLRDSLIGAAGVLQVTIEEKPSQVVLDYNPQRTTQQELEQLVISAGYTLEKVEFLQPEHQHSISGFIKRLWS